MLSTQLDGDATNSGQAKVGLQASNSILAGDAAFQSTK